MGLLEQLHIKLDATATKLEASLDRRVSRQRAENIAKGLCPFCFKTLATPNDKKCPFCFKTWHDVPHQDYASQNNSANRGDRPKERPSQNHGSEHGGSASGGDSQKAKATQDRVHHERPVMNVHDAREILGVVDPATPASVRAAYRKAVVRYHPDRLDGMAPEIVKLATLRMTEINRANEILMASFTR